MLECKNISKKFGEHILQNISFEVASGEYFVILGKSGVGKTVLLEIIAGLLEPDSGSIVLDGHNITRTRIQKRNIGIVFQDNTLFPHMSIRRNI